MSEPEPLTDEELDRYAEACARVSPQLEPDAAPLRLLAEVRELRLTRCGKCHKTEVEQQKRVEYFERLWRQSGKERDFLYQENAALRARIERVYLHIKDMQSREDTTFLRNLAALASGQVES